MIQIKGNLPRISILKRNYMGTMKCICLYPKSFQQMSIYFWSVFFIVIIISRVKFSLLLIAESTNNNQVWQVLQINNRKISD